MTISLSELERLHAAATPGPWALTGAHRLAFCQDIDECDGQCRRDTDLVEASRNALPAMLRALRAGRDSELPTYCIENSDDPCGRCCRCLFREAMEEIGE